MIREYVGAHEYLDDITAQAERLLRRHQQARVPNTHHDTARALAELDLEAQRASEWMRARCEASHGLGIEIPLERLRRAFALTHTEIAVVEVLVALELSSRVRELAVPFLDKGGMATTELVEAIVYRAKALRGRSGEELEPDGALFRHQIAHCGGGELPWLARPIKVAKRVVELALGRLRLDPEVARVATLFAEPVRGEHLLQDPRPRALVATALRDSHAGSAVPLVVGPEGSGRASVVFAAAAELGLPVLAVTASALPHDQSLMPLLCAIRREATLFGTVLLLRGLENVAGDAEPQAADRIDVVATSVAGANGPVAITATSNVWPPAVHRSAVVVELGIPSEGDRETLWKRAVGDPDVAARAAQRYRVTPGILERAAAYAKVQAAARAGAIVLDDVRVGVRLQLDRDLSQLGRRVDWQQDWEDVVLPDDVRVEIEELVGRIRYRRRVLDEWGFERKLAKGIGVSALFSGPPGTGKTMVAALVAKELELDLYMIDASRMVSKWIGETEKNLARLFDAAGAGHAALLFDEADSLFAKRTEVNSSTDRYANLEVNYLLQRMEAFEGITILTTNLESSIDEAFKRRLAFRIHFPMPEAEERTRLWRAMLPREAAIAGDIDFDMLARRFEMSGGYIRNAVVRAAYLAAADNTAIGMRHLQRGAVLEYTAMGKVIHASSSL